MKYRITKGLGLISIGMSDIGSYFNYVSPLAISWFDCRGSLAKYLCIFPDENGYRTTVTKKIKDNLEQDFTEKTNLLHEILEPLLNLFENGEYFLNFYNSEEKRLFKYNSSSDNFEKEHLSSFSIEITDETNSYLSSVNGSKPSLNKTYNYYEGNSVSFIATEPFSNINQEQVKYYEELIKQGKRPFAIVYNSEFYSNNEEADWISEKYIIDGHHKLLAYSNLKIYPAIAMISKVHNSKNEIPFDFQSLKKRLYKVQSEHIINNWEDKDYYENGVRTSK